MRWWWAAALALATGLAWWTPGQRWCAAPIAIVTIADVLARRAAAKRGPRRPQVELEGLRRARLEERPGRESRQASLLIVLMLSLVALLAGLVLLGTGQL